MSGPLKPIKRVKSTRPCFRQSTPIYSNEVLVANFPELSRPNAASFVKKPDYFAYKKPYKSVEQTADFNTMFNNEELFESLIKPKIVSKDLALASNEEQPDKEEKNPVIPAKLQQLPIINDDRNVVVGASKSYIEHMWNEIIDPQINNPLEAKLTFNYQSHPAKLRRSASNKNFGYKAIRIFVSSTFTDFFNEREVLVKQVFPELREWCFQRNLDIIECDLRWGVPIDSTSDETILACMNELDRCYEDNHGQPFFIGMLGEKYGWIPDIGKLSSEIVEEYNWVPKVSITFMEFLHGALRSKNRNACFFIRDPSSLDEIPDEYREKFFEENTFSKMQLEYEKKKLREYHPTQVFDYKCHYEGIDESTGRKKVKLGGLVEFGQTVLNYFKNAIEKSYPDCKTAVEPTSDNNPDDHEEVIQTEYDMEDIHQRMFINEKLNFYIGRQAEFKKLVDLIEKDKRVHDAESEPSALKTFRVDDMPKPSQAKITNKNALIITGNEGCGKTTLLSYLTNYLEEKHNVFYHFYDASAKSQELDVLRVRFVKFFSNYLGYPEIFKQYLKSNSTDASGIIYDLCEKLNEYQEQKGSAKVAIILDGIERNIKFNLELIPTMKLTNPKIKIIYSISSAFKRLFYDFEANEILQDSCDVLELQDFDIESSRLFIKTFLAKYNKKLDDKQMALILAKFENKTPPLWLTFAVNELRIFGEFTTLTNYIRELPNDLDGLISKIIRRINGEFKGDIVRKILCAIEVSGVGVPESDTIILFSEFKEVNQDDEITNLLWSQIMRNLKPFLMYSQFYKTQLIKFTHNCLSKVIREMFLDNKSDDETYHEKYYHLKLIEYYRNVCKYRKFACHQVCHHYKSVGDRASLAKFLRSKEVAFYINTVMRTLLFQEIRCKNHSLTEDSYKLKMCFGCCVRVGDLNFAFINRNSCFLCGASVFQPTRHDALVCSHHRETNVPEHMFKCCICKTLKPINSTLEALKPVNASVCNFCGNSRTCCAVSVK